MTDISARAVAKRVYEAAAAAGVEDIYVMLHEHGIEIIAHRNARAASRTMIWKELELAEDANSVVDYTADFVFKSLAYKSRTG